MDQKDLEIAALRRIIDVCRETMFHLKCDWSDIMKQVDKQDLIMYDPDDGDLKHKNNELDSDED